MKNFLNTFSLKSSACESVKVVIGEQPYKQSLNNIGFAVDGSFSSVKIYNLTGNIAFLVTDWIKIQDSLEMTFNLIMGRKNSLEALCILRKLKISPIEFADFLWENARLVLLNRHVNSVDNKLVISEFIKNNAKLNPVNVLFVGNKAELNFAQLPENCNSACAIHPSGTNLNLPERRIRYYDNWYTFEGKKLINKSESFSLSNFRIFE